MKQLLHFDPEHLLWSEGVRAWWGMALRMRGGCGKIKNQHAEAGDDNKRRGKHDQIFLGPVLYAGHVLEGDGVGFSGTPANDRWYPNDRFVQAFDIAKETAQSMEELGYDILWMAEHHFQREGYECIPNLPMLSLWLAQHTERLKFGCAFNILPMWHPLRLAEDFAMADILTGGRVIFGVGRGYHTREVETFDAPMMDVDANRDLFEEQLEVILKAFHEESFSHNGKHYTLPPEVPYRGYQPRARRALFPMVRTGTELTKWTSRP